MQDCNICLRYETFSKKYRKDNVYLRFIGDCLGSTKGWGG
jgi:hypothetical protein